jgi:hypothetical protein
MILGGCDTRIEETPTEVVEQRAESSIRAAGGDPSDWIIEGSCIGMGPCSATVFAAAYPDLELAQTGYTVKDSRAFPKSPNGIRQAAARAVERNCFERALSSQALEACIAPAQ